MSARIRFGLICGAVAMVLNIIVGSLLGICGPVVSAVAGALAGYFSAKKEQPPSQNLVAKVGAIAGAIAGSLALFGQMLGGIGSLMLVPFVWRAVDIPLVGVSGQASYWLSGLTTALCLGVVGIGLSAGIDPDGGPSFTPQETGVQ